MGDNLFQQAKNAIANLTNTQGNANQSNQADKQAANNAIQAAYNDATPEEQEQLQQLEQQLKDENHLS